MSQSKHPGGRSRKTLEDAHIKSASANADVQPRLGQNLIEGLNDVIEYEKGKRKLRILSMNLHHNGSKR